jgi:two-component system, cell cycle sensor histidine kinase and response regulator CckA
MITDGVDRKYAHALAEFAALTDTVTDCEFLIKSVVQAIMRHVTVDHCHIYRRGSESLVPVAAAPAATDDSAMRNELLRVATHTLKQHEHGLTEPVRTDGSVSLVIEGDSAPFGVCVVNSHSAGPLSADDIEFVRSIAGLLSGAFRRAHAVRDKARLRALVASADDAIVEVTRDGRIFNWNVAAETLFGYPRDAIVGHSVSTLLDEHGASEVAAILAEVCRGATIGAQDTVVRTIDGSAIDVVVRYTPIILPDGRITAATLTVRDVREKRAADRQLQMHTDILAHMPAAVMVWRLDDPDDSSSLRLVFANREASMATGCVLDACIGTRFSEVACSPVVISDVELYAGVARTGIPQDLGEHPGSHRQNPPPWFHVQALPLPDNSVGVVFQDVTERRALTEQLRHAQRMEVVGRLAGGVAHDFNNILTVVNGYSELLRLKLAKHPSALDDLTEIERAGESARQLTRQLLAFGRRQTLRPAPVDLTDLVRSARGMLTRLIGEDVQLCVLGSEPVTVVADPGQIEQVLLNLAVNARDAMPAGGKLFLESSIVHIDHDMDECQSVDDPCAHMEPGLYGMLTVSDTGLGMDPPTLARIFEPFFTTKEAGKGTGLGLSTVHGIVKQTGGQIAVTSESGQGTTFKIYLPTADGRSIASKAKLTPPSRLALKTRLGPSKTVLLVEDDDAVRYLVRRVLTSSGFHVLEASGPLEAQSVLGKVTGTVDLLLSDVVMSAQSGPELASRLTLKFPGLPVVYMSGYVPDLAGHRKLPTEAKFLQKPFTRDELLDVVREALQVA